MKNIFIKAIATRVLTFALALSTVTVPTPQAVVDRIEDGIVTVEVSAGDAIQMFNIDRADFNSEVAECDSIDVLTVKGSFIRTFTDVYGQVYFLFRSYDKEVQWALKPEQIGFTPTKGKSYYLTYCNNGTTDCAERETLDCECYLYDDLFLGVWG